MLMTLSPVLRSSRGASVLNNNCPASPALTGGAAVFGDLTPVKAGIRTAAALRAILSGVSRGLGAIEREVLLELARYRVDPASNFLGVEGDDFAPVVFLDSSSPRSSVRRAVSRLAGKGLVETAVGTTERDYRRSDGDLVPALRHVLTVRLPWVRHDASIAALAPLVVEHFSGLAEAISRFEQAERALLEADMVSHRTTTWPSPLREPALLNRELREADLKRVLGYHGPRLAVLRSSDAVGWEHVFARWAAHVAFTRQGAVNPPLDVK
jgi:hypothetical protein